MKLELQRLCHATTTPCQSKCNMSGNVILVNDLNFCGLAAAVFVEIRRSKTALPLTVRQQMPPKSATPSPWQMNRATLIQTLEERGITYKPEWTVPELRATLLEVNQAMEADNKQMVGLTRMNIDELKEKCLQEGISLPAKYSRGSLMKLLRESQSPTGEEHVCFGSYKGYKFKEVHEGYLQWAMEETANNPNHCPDLARLAKWAGRRQTETSGAASGSGDPEANAVIAPPKVLPKPKQLQATPTTNKSSRTSRTRVIQTEEDSSDFSLVEQTTEEQISDLETRLAVLKSINKVEDEHAEKRKMELQ